MTALFSCESGFWNCLTGNGIPAEETRYFAEFDGFVSEGSFDILVISDSAYSVTVEADENLLRYIRTRVSGHRLIIDTGTRRCLRSDTPMLLTIRMPYVNCIELTGSGQITGDDFTAEVLRLKISGSGEIDMRGLDIGSLDALITGSGDMIFWGIADVTDFDITGSGRIDAYHLDADRCSASISGSGSMFVTVETLLRVIITGSGDVFYRGNCSVETTIEGSGSVINTNK